MATNLYTDLTPRQTAFHVVKTLKRLRPQILLGRFAQTKVVPKHKTDVVKWMRYRKIANAGILNEGSAPKGKSMQSDVITAKLEQIGDVIKFTDVAIDTHPDDLISEAQMILDEQILDTTEKIYVDNIRGGAQFLYAGGATSRVTAAAYTAQDFRSALLLLKNNNSKPITRMLTGDVDYNTTPIEAAYIAYCSPSMETVLRNTLGASFVTSDKYAGQTTLLPGEFGRFENCRFVISTLAGDEDLVGLGAGGADVHRCVIFGQDAFGGVPFAGPKSLNLYVRMPKSTVGDELAQTAYVGWKSRFNAAILQQKSIVRLEGLLA